MDSKMNNLSAVVITKNESHNIEDCIASLQSVSDDIIVVDCGSTDNTVALAESLGARVFQREWTGYSDQKNFGNKQAIHDYVLSLDADERLSIEVAKSINQEFENPSHKAYALPFLTAWKGKLIKHGAWGNDWHVCLFCKNEIEWVGRGIHEGLDTKGLPIKRLHGFVYHYTADKNIDYRNKMTRYAQEFAAANKIKNKRFPFWKKYVSSIARFFSDYVFKRGFLDGRAGWEIVKEDVRYTFLKYKLSE